MSMARRIGRLEHDAAIAELYSPDFETHIREVAEREGIDPDEAVRVALRLRPALVKGGVAEMWEASARDVAAKMGVSLDEARALLAREAERLG